MFIRQVSLRHARRYCSRCCCSAAASDAAAAAAGAAV